MRLKIYLKRDPVIRSDQTYNCIPFAAHVEHFRTMRNNLKGLSDLASLFADFLFLAHSQPTLHFW